MSMACAMGALDEVGIDETVNSVKAMAGENLHDINIAIAKVEKRSSETLKMAEGGDFNCEPIPDAMSGNVDGMLPVGMSGVKCHLEG